MQPLTGHYLNVPRAGHTMASLLPTFVYKSAANPQTFEFWLDRNTRNESKPHLPDDLIPTQPFELDSGKLPRRKIAPSLWVSVRHTFLDNRGSN